MPKIPPPEVVFGTEGWDEQGMGLWDCDGKMFWAPGKASLETSYGINDANLCIFTGNSIHTLVSDIAL